MSSFTPDQSSELVGGIDLGGTKIETTLFDNGLIPLETRRQDTPGNDYFALKECLIGEVSHLRSLAGQEHLPVGIGIPGLADPETGIAKTTNLPATGKNLRADVLQSAKGIIAVENDCKCFALSEALGGSGENYDTVFGLILGTGTGGGVVRHKKLDCGLNRVAGEVGHIGLPTEIVARHGLPVLECGCGRIGCYETLVSGQGIVELSRALIDRSFSARDLVEKANSDQQEVVLSVWSNLLAEMLLTLVLTVDPNCIVLGGGLSRIGGIEDRLTNALGRIALPTLRLPDILLPTFGDSSGARGAALLARQLKEQQI